MQKMYQETFICELKRLPSTVADFVLVSLYIRTVSRKQLGQTLFVSHILSFVWRLKPFEKTKNNIKDLFRISSRSAKSVRWKRRMMSTLQLLFVRVNAGRVGPTRVLMMDLNDTKWKWTILKCILTIAWINLSSTKRKENVKTIQTLYVSSSNNWTTDLVNFELNSDSLWILFHL